MFHLPPSSTSIKFIKWTNVEEIGEAFLIAHLEGTVGNVSPNTMYTACIADLLALPLVL